jgi:hypothetical protein
MSLYGALLLSLLLSACASAAPAPTEAPAVTQPPAAAPTSSEARAVPTDAPAPTAPVVKTDFTPTDPATVNLAAGRPQFVEFFAFW